MSNSLFILLTYQAVFFMVRYIYKNHIEKKYNYVIPTKKGFGVDRNATHFDEEVIHNKKLKSEINTLFLGENIGAFIMVIGGMYVILI